MVGWLSFHLVYTVKSRYLEVDGTIFYKFKLLEVQINLHFGLFGLVKKSPTPNYGWRRRSKCIFDSDRRFEFPEFEISRFDCVFYISLHAVLPLLMLQIYRTGIPFIYTVRFVGDRWDEGEVERS